MNLVLTGSIAFDYLMHFPGLIKDHILADRLESLSLSFLVDTLVRQRGGIAANIGYTLALLGERPKIMATVGEDFEEYRSWLESKGVDTSLIRAIPGTYTASFFVTSDEAGAQIASFYTGAMAHAGRLRFSELPTAPDLVMISPNDPGAMQAYVRECKALGISYLYDPSQQILRLDGDALKEGIDGAAGLFANDYELGLIQEKAHWELGEITERVGFAVITKGELGSELFEGESRTAIPIVPAASVQDPTGVGDAYRGGFLKGFMHGLSLECCCKMGALAATFSAESEGPQGHDFGFEQFTSRFEEHFGIECRLSEQLRPE